MTKEYIEREEALYRPLQSRANAVLEMRTRGGAGDV